MGVLYEEEDRKWKKNKSGQIPAFGNWEYTNDLPITQYFESARQAGLVHASYSSAADSGEYCNARYQHLYALRRSNYRPPPPKAKAQLAREHGRQSLKKENKADYPTEQPRQSKLTNKDNRGGGATRVPPGKQKQKTTNVINVRAVDEDLYKIPPELLHSSKRKKRLGLFSCCMVPACTV